MGFKVKHGFSKHPLYNTWNGMMQRCYNKDLPGYSNWGGRGIRVCKEWQSIKQFISDMSPKPKGFSLERIDNNKSYSRENCKWIPRKKQSANRRNVKLISYNGKTKTIPEWCKILGINRKTLWKRLNEGWSIEKSLMLSIRRAGSDYAIQRHSYGR